MIHNGIHHYRRLDFAVSEIQGNSTIGEALHDHVKLFQLKTEIIFLGKSLIIQQVEYNTNTEQQEIMLSICRYCRRDESIPMSLDRGSAN